MKYVLGASLFLRLIIVAAPKKLNLTENFRKSELLEYLFANMVEKDGVYKTVIGSDAIENEAELYLIPHRNDLRKRKLNFRENGVMVTTDLVQEIRLDRTSADEYITVIFSQRTGKDS